LNLLRPPHPLGQGVSAFFTTRHGGVSTGAFGLEGGAPGGLNLADHVGDDPSAVQTNRARLRTTLPADPVWLSQVHGAAVHEVDGSIQRVTDRAGSIPVADGAVTDRSGSVLAVLTADCLPVLLADADGRVIGAAHAGWRGLAAGILEETVAVMLRRCSKASLRAWIGPAIHQSRYEVGDDVRSAILESSASGGDSARLADTFQPGRVSGKWLFDLPGLATLRLERLGVTVLPYPTPCTAANPDRFWSFRRDRSGGRTAGCIWLERV
jgi:polyphenol oxidase